ncbi:hypothetical protein [Prauserella muralis]|uniref:Mce-associated membrane protein n=1 Tax=Prauserella muralis TaxID=588067 RepID=A0A2V4AJE6_9PSEU|nr:hypothetical protein [Prauserella muralis]PXY19751.1 hypothetical protein BAY60_32925 [Prauserella muralis]
MAVLAAVIVLAAGAAVWSGLQARQLRAAGDNVALADPVATREVTRQVTGALKSIFSYDYNNLARTERAAERVLAGEAVEQYGRSFAAAKAQARDGKLVRTTTVRSLGVRSLTAQRAHLLALLDQQTLHTAGNDRQESATAVLVVTAENTGGQWKITSLTSV